ncbi:MAG: fibronectin type III domain-containing protein [Myxococcales bacterium]|nr:fibronectin type III domain-containing protein [Myxococcales bacterium]
MRTGLVSAALLAAATQLASPVAADPQCRVIDLDLQPSDDLQMVAWLEDSAGNYIATLFITDAVGRRGIGNRPGRYDFNSGPRWPYGRRITTFPIWSHKHGLEFPSLEFQNRDDSNLSHPFNQSSSEAFFCRPLAPNEPGWDTATCSSPIFTDKGKVTATGTSLYPPREDIARVDGIDDPAVGMFDQMNPFDEVSQATPAADLPFSLSWPMPGDLPQGDYVVVVEVNKEFDHNSSYRPEDRPSPTGIPWSNYGLPYRGQPSVVYRLPVTVGTSTMTAMTATYAGYGDPDDGDGVDGDLRAPDATISTGVPGSGAARLLLRTDGADTFRVRATARPEDDSIPPGPATELGAPELTPTAATITFVAPGDDGGATPVTGYEVRYRAVEPITDANFATSSPISQAIAPDDPGQVQLFDLTGLLPETTYYVAVRAYDECRNYGPIATASFTTPARAAGEVDACFVATAAYGTLMANEVSHLRQFRDGLLRRSVLGELFVETYYAVGPAFATVVDHSDPLRAAARDGLGPLVGLVRGLKYEAP